MAAPAQRIVALSPHLAELAFAAGAGRQLVGVVRHSDYPPAVRDLPQTGDAARVDFERIAMLTPDLVLAWRSGNPAGDVARVEQLGFPVFVTEPAHLTDIPRLLRAIGVLAGTRPAAETARPASSARLRRCAPAMRKRPGCGCSTRSGTGRC